MLAAEPGSGSQNGVLRMSGATSTGGVAGKFTLLAAISGARSRIRIVSGGVADEDGWDGSSWAAHDGIMEQVDLPGAMQDARTETFLRVYGWRDRRNRRFARPAGVRHSSGASYTGISFAIPKASAVTLWFDDASHRLADASIEADMGTVAVRFSDWRWVGRAEYAFWRSRRDPTGQEMTLTASTGALVSGAKFIRPSPTARSNLGASTTVPFILDHGDTGHIVIEVAIDGRAAKLVFDTGAANFVTPDVAAAYGLTIAGGLSIGGVGETSFNGGFAQIANLSIGSAALIGTSAIVAPLPEAALRPRPGIDLQGLTGFELIRSFTTTIDYAARTITFAPPRSTRRLAGALPYRSDGQSLFVQATVNGRRGWFRLDSGDPGTVTLFARFAALGRITDDGKVLESAQAGGSLRTSAISLRSLSLGETELEGLKGEISHQSAGAFVSRSIAGNLGAGVLSCFRLSIDPLRRNVSFARFDSQHRPSTCLVEQRSSAGP